VGWLTVYQSEEPEEIAILIEHMIQELPTLSPEARQEAKEVVESLLTLLQAPPQDQAHAE